jgi:hypothetical protein
MAVKPQNRLECNARAAHEWRMSFLASLFRAKPAARTAGQSAPVLWRKNDFIAYSVGHDAQAVLLRNGTPQVLPGFVVDFVNSCEEFDLLEKHVATYAEKHAWGSLETRALESWIERVAAAKLIVSSRDLLAACERHSALPPPSISAIGFPTGGDRTDLVGRAFSSFAANLKRHGRTADFLIADSSNEARHRDVFRAAGAAWAKEQGIRIRYAGSEEKRRLAEALLRRGLAPDVVEFALFDPLEVGFACGANRNAMLLHEAGRMFCSVDDDVVCELAGVPSNSARLKLFSSCDPFTRWMFKDRASALAHGESIDVDFLGSHEELLGRGLKEIAGGLDVSDLDVSQVGDELLRRAWSADGRVRASFSGHAGDPGIPTSVYFLFYDGENRRRLTRSEEEYAAFLASRSVFALAPCHAVGDSSTSPGMAMGLDHRSLLPPFFPVLHAEDFIYGATLWQTIGSAFLGHVPVAVRHEPRPGKSILRPGDLHGERRAVIFEFAHLIRRIILRFQRDESAGDADRMRSLGRHLTSIAAQPLEDFCEFIRGQVLEHESSKIDRLEKALREDDEAPEFWRRDLETYLEHVRDALTYADFDIPFDLKGDRSDDENRRLMQQLFGRYGALLEAWPDIVAAAREINERTDWMPAL